MAPEHEARMRVLYDHESEDTGRRVPSGNPSGRVAGQRRRAVADWGVGEDIFDRMPSRRFTRTERRAAHSGTVVIARDPNAVRAEVEPGQAPSAEPRRSERGPEPEPRRSDPEPRREREVESWFEAEPQPRPERAPAEPPARLVAASTHSEPAGRLATLEPPTRRTVVISGHPGGLPAARPARPPKTAIERVGTRPDRIVAYAVALGFLLVLIAILTTGQ